MSVTKQSGTRDYVPNLMKQILVDTVEGRKRCPTPHVYSHLELMHEGRHET
jgi:hypothetical protein